MAIHGKKKEENLPNDFNLFENNCYALCMIG